MGKNNKINFNIKFYKVIRVKFMLGNIHQKRKF